MGIAPFSSYLLPSAHQCTKSVAVPPEGGVADVAAQSVGVLALVRSAVSAQSRRAPVILVAHLAPELRDACNTKSNNSQTSFW